MKIAYIHFRPDPVILDQERRGLLRNTELAPDDVVSLNVFDRVPTREDMGDFDAVIFGGSGDFFVSRGDIPEILGPVGELICDLNQNSLPMVGICFGAQVMTHALGGVVEMDTERAELGTYTIQKTIEAQRCPVFKHLPEQFDVQLGHKDHITQLPPGAVNLATSPLSTVQAFTFPGKMTYGFTFHPELDTEGMKERLRYMVTIPDLRDKYHLTQETMDTLLGSMWDSEYASMPLKNFLKHIQSQTFSS